MKYKIIDGDKKTLMKGFRNWQSAKTMFSQLKIHKSEKLEIIEDEEKGYEKVKKGLDKLKKTWGRN